MSDINAWFEHNWKANFLFDFSPGSRLFWRVVGSNASLWDIFFCFDGRLVSLPQVWCNVACSALDYSQHRKVCSTPLWSWRGIELFSLVSAPGVLSLWCLILTHGSNIYERWIFVGNLFRVYSYLACCTAQCFLVRFFICFDGRLVSLPYVLCKLSVAPHSMMYTIVEYIPLLFGVYVEMTCSLLSLRLAFYACDAWE